ncbi:Glutathionedependent formaldehydeactivating enzyme EC 44122 [Bradyrhizobium sp.]|nr:Glutathionedependent formaldehydeactivating enzyme EC 44122 [Bradyrhizobium sp.]
MVPRQNVTVLENGDKLQIVDPSAVIQRYACKACGTHMYGRIENKGHPFYGLDFIHPELFQEQGSQAPFKETNALYQRELPIWIESARSLGLEPS